MTNGAHNHTRLWNAEQDKGRELVTIILSHSQRRRIGDRRHAQVATRDQAAASSSEQTLHPSLIKFAPQPCP